MESNLQQCTFLESSADGTQNRGEGIPMKGEDRRVVLLGGWVEHRLHNAEIVGHYVITNSHVPCVCIQADWFHPCNPISGQLDNLKAHEFFSLGMILEEISLFLLDRDSGVLLWLAH